MQIEDRSNATASQKYAKNCGQTNQKLGISKKNSPMGFKGAWPARHLDLNV